jgi:hypothetical protein
MRPIYLTLAAGITVAATALAIGAFAPAAAQQKGGKAAKTPDSWSYEVRDGKRVPRGNRVTNADGSWREEIRQGDCTVVKTMSADGEYREVREC